jgi:hypothetical protein
MKVDICQGVCYDSPAECVGPENGTRLSQELNLFYKQVLYVGRREGFIED